MPTLLRLVIPLALAAGALSGTAHAQAWVGQKGGLNLATDYIFSPSDKIIEDYEFAVPVVDHGLAAQVYNHSITFAAEYMPIDKLALMASAAVVSLRYKEGSATYPAHGLYDDDNYHTVLQDARLGARYMVVNDPVAVSPHVGFSMPITDYETVGFASAGRGLKQLHLGLSVGKFFTESALANFYVHGFYEFSLVERYKTLFPETADYGQNRSDLRGLFGYFITDDFEVNLAFDIRIPHGGLAFTDWPNVPQAVIDYHDPLLAESFVMVGAGVSYQLTEQLRLTALARRWIGGANTRNGDLFGGGVSWDFL